ncbi:FixH family protein [Anoxybacteroides amylolyticum]|uniref:YtkA-like family protein n=1 Tax=Anoxybacteroides amylolyticum TaxID=294699 RepID=A0A160F5D7_9BACL|nr:FixH family protein [Anoxybacillus amylolyticus]ANB61729.1 ytkA-like family protein [Anoxybacillus amylolyticus]
MKRKMFFLLASFVIILIAACSHTEHREEQEILNVKIEAKSPMDVNKTTEISCLVTYGNEKVDDADEVKFEIWKQGSEKHEMLPAKNKGNGKYAVTKTFTEAGTYSIVAHVTAHNMHNMPKTDIVVGNPSASTTEHDHHSDVMIMLMKQPYEANKQAKFVAHVTHDNKPLVGADVHFEIWKGNGKHEVIDATEKGKGEYEATTTFKEKGTYFVKVHVETKDLHDHQIEQVTVQ